eukprot:1916641-Pyramimonas_sp.AAC.1
MAAPAVDDVPAVDDAMPALPSPPSPPYSALDVMAPTVGNDAPTVDDAMPTVPSLPAPNSGLDDMAPMDGAPTVDDTPVVDDAMPTAVGRASSPVEPSPAHRWTAPWR